MTALSVRQQHTKILSVPPLLLLGPIVLVCMCACVLTGAGHGGRVGVSAEESRVAVADGGPVSQAVAVWRTFGTGCVRGPGFVEPRGAGCRGDRGGQDADTSTSITRMCKQNVCKLKINRTFERFQGLIYVEKSKEIY